MKKTFDILWAAVAENDLIGIIEYIANDDPVTALQILKKIKTATIKTGLFSKTGSYRSRITETWYLPIPRDHHPVLAGDLQNR